MGVLTARPEKVSDLPVWNYDGSSTEQADGHNSEINIKPRALFDDPFRGYPHVMVLTDAYNAWDDLPAIGNTRAACAEIHKKYKKHDAWYGIEQEYTLMKPGKVGMDATIPSASMRMVASQLHKVHTIRVQELVLPLVDQ